MPGPAGIRLRSVLSGAPLLRMHLNVIEQWPVNSNQQLAQLVLRRI